MVCPTCPPFPLKKSDSPFSSIIACDISNSREREPCHLDLSSVALALKLSLLLDLFFILCLVTSLAKSHVEIAS